MSGGRRVMTMAEIHQGARDQDAGVHWCPGRCWCRTSHSGDEAGLRFVPPPWDRTGSGT